MKGSTGPNKKSHRDTNQTPGFQKKNFEPKSELFRVEPGLESSREHNRMGSKVRTGVVSPVASS